MDAISQTIFSYPFSWMKIYEFRLIFHWILFLRVKLTIPALVQIMTWRRTGDKPLSEPMLIILLTHICVTRPRVVSYPFPDSNIYSSLGYSTFYSQIIRFHRLCNNKSDFLFRAKLIYQKLINSGYKFNLLRKTFMGFINKYPAESKYGVQRHDNLFLQMLYFDNYVVCNINRDDVKKIVTPCFV